MVCIFPKAGNHFGRPKDLSYHLGHSCCWPPPRSETEEGCYLGREHSYCYYFKLKIIRKMFIPIRNKNIDRAMLANLEPPPSKTTAMWGPEGAGTMVCVVCDVHVFVNGCRHVCTLSKSSPEKQKNILPVKSLQKSWRGTFKELQVEAPFSCHWGVLTYPRILWFQYQLRTDTIHPRVQAKNLAVILLSPYAPYPIHQKSWLLYSEIYPKSLHFSHPAISVFQSLSPLTWTKPPEWSPCFHPCCPTVHSLNSS